MKTGLAGKIVLITGARRNHGRASALAFTEEGAHLLFCLTTLDAMDALNQAIYAHCSYTSGPVYVEAFLTSKTTLWYEDYGSVPQPLATYAECWGNFLHTLQRILGAPRVVQDT